MPARVAVAGVANLRSRISNIIWEGQRKWWTLLTLVQPSANQRTCAEVVMAPEHTRQTAEGVFKAPYPLQHYHHDSNFTPSCVAAGECARCWAG